MSGPHSSTLAWKIPWTKEPGRLQSMGLLRVRHDWGSDTTERLHFHFSLSCIGEGNGNPLQCSRLENPRDGGAWWAAVYGVAQSWTRLKWLSSSSRVSGGPYLSPTPPTTQKPKREFVAWLLQLLGAASTPWLVAASGQSLPHSHSAFSSPVSVPSSPDSPW